MRVPTSDIIILPDDPEIAADLEYLTPEELRLLDLYLRDPRDRYNPHQPTARQKIFLELDCLDAFYGGAAGGGKTDALLMAALQYVDVPGYAALLLMKTFSDLSKPKALMDRAHEWLQGSGAIPKEGGKRWEFPNVAGPPATLDFGYLQTDKDKYNYRTAEYQFIGVDELTRFLEKTFTYLFSRLRRLKAAAHIPIRMRSASNPAQPGEPGMQWVEARYIPEDFDPEVEATKPPRILTKDGVNQQDGKKITRMFVFARLEDNPHLDADEYELSLGELDAVTHAQLRRGDWKIRHRGDIYFNFDSRYIFVPWSRWEAVFKVRHIPNHWLLSTSQDQGTSEAHIGATGWFATAAQNSPIDDLVAMYRAFTAIEMAATEVGDAMLTLMGSIPEPLEKPNQEEGLTADGWGGQAEYGRLKKLISSHEGKSERLEYQKMKPPLRFEKWTSGPNIGIAQMRDYIRIIDRDKPNPFFPELMGRTRFVCVVPDEDWPRRRQNSVWARVEAEFHAYHYKQLISGEPTTSNMVVPDAKFNDYMDAIRAAAFDAFPRPKPMTKAERIEEQLDDNVKLENIPALETEEDKSRALLAHQVWSKEIQEREEEERRLRGGGRFGRGVRVPARPRVPRRR